MSYCLIQGDSKDVLKTFPANYFDSCVCDPPYGLSFMGKAWDYDVPQVDLWREVWRVMKPGAYLLAFFGTRTYHRGVVQIEDAGFEIRDMIEWMYASGFPKSLDVSKAIDKAAGAKREKVGRRKHPTLVDSSKIEESANAAHGENMWGREWDITAPATEAAKKWQGWGTAKKPAHEPIVVARKPIIGTVAENVLRYGTGVINIDGCRIDFANDKDIESAKWGRGIDIMGGNYVGATHTSGKANIEANPLGRWPANLIHDGSEEVLACFPDAPGQMAAVGPEYGSKSSVNAYGNYGPRELFEPRIELNKSAARFFYCAKASRADRNEGLERFEKKNMYWSSGDQSPGSFQAPGTDRTSQNNWPTVKPTTLMRYLLRLVTQPGGITLDPFTGSGSTGKAAMYEGFNFVGIELQPMDIAGQRIAWAGYDATREERKKQTEPQISLFDCMEGASR